MRPPPRSATIVDSFRFHGLCKEMIVPIRPNTEPSMTRTKAAAATLALFSASYAVYGLWYLYHDFFKFLGRGMPTVFDGSGYAVQVNCYMATVLSPWRVVGLLLAVALLGLSARQLLRQRPGARALSLFTLWGVLLPQLLWATEFMVDWNNGQDLVTTVLTGLTLVMIPTAFLFQGESTLGDWRRMSQSRARLLLTAIASAWVAFGATEFLDHSYQHESSLAYSGAMAAAILGGFGAMGLMRLRVWGLFAALVGAGCLAVVPLAINANFGQYLPSGGYIDAFVVSTSACSLTATVSSLVPTVLIAGLAAPFLRSAIRRLKA